MPSNFYMILFICLGIILFLFMIGLVRKCCNFLPCCYHQRRIKKTPTPIQLKNLGNTCYFNAVLQNLFQTQVLRERLKNYVNRTRDGTLTKSMIEFYSAETHFTPEKLLKIIQLKSGKFESYKQGDSHELLRHLLHGLIDEEQKTKQIEKSQVESVFRGHIISSFICSKCCQGDHRIEKYLDLSIPISFLSTDDDGDCKTILESIKNKGSTCEYSNILLQNFLKVSYNTKNDISIEDCLYYFTKRSFLSEYLCQNCYHRDPSIVDDMIRMPRGVTRTQIIDLPPVLVIHLKRFELLPDGSFQKCNRPVAYKEVLDMSAFCFDVPSKFSPSLSKTNFYISASECDSSSGLMDSNGNNKSNIDEHAYQRETPVKIPYKLYGIVVHAGTMDCGHYVAYVKQRKNLNDDLLVKEHKFDGNIVSKDWIVDAANLTKFDKSDVTIQIDPPKISTDEDDLWYYVSDSTIQEVTKERSLSQQASLLFYERHFDLNNKN